MYKYARMLRLWNLSGIPEKAATNFRKHGFRFVEAATVFDDDALLTMVDEHPKEERFVALGTGSLGRILVVLYTPRGERIRIISARKATRTEQQQYEKGKFDTNTTSLKHDADL